MTLFGHQTGDRSGSSGAKSGPRRWPPHRIRFHRSLQGFECPFRQCTREMKRRGCSREPHGAVSGVPDAQVAAVSCAHLPAFVVDISPVRPPKTQCTALANGSRSRSIAAAGPARRRGYRNKVMAQTREGRRNWTLARSESSQNLPDKAVFQPSTGGFRDPAISSMTEHYRREGSSRIGKVS